MSKGLGRVQREILLQVARWEMLTTSYQMLKWSVAASAPALSRALKSLETQGYIIRDGDEFRATSKGQGAFARLIEDKC